ncbi:MAG: hypothetical protein O2985_13425 [Proteobacteria bacterium]|nr:hypothetical protein [Pseudomonadota bacterium]
MSTGKRDGPAYEAAKRAAQGANPAERLNLASNPDVVPAIPRRRAKPTAFCPATPMSMSARNWRARSPG